jgi:hypothetical protein
VLGVRELVIDKKKWKDIVRQTKAHSANGRSSLRSLEETRILVSSAKRMVWETLFMMHGESLI